MAHQSEALVLRRLPFGESDLILHLLLPGSGRLTAIAKGARRSVKRFSGTLDAFERMLELEAETYDRWLASPQPILSRILEYFEPIVFRERLGHLIFIGAPRKSWQADQPPLTTSR